MKKYKCKGLLYGEGPVYVLESLEDWDEYEKICKEENPDFIKLNPNFYAIKEEFKEYIGRVWEDKSEIRYKLNGKPVYKEYYVVGVEDNCSWMDWYWILQNVDDPKDIKNILVNSHDLKNGLK